MKQLNEINEIDWMLILSSRDTVKYISKADLINFSLICKFLRNRLLSHVFYSIVLRSFSERTNDLPLYTMNTEIESKVLDRYDKHLNKQIPHVRSLVHEHDYSEILILHIPQVFDKLSRLQLFDSSFTLDTFHKLMSGLNHLKSLSIEFSLFLVFDTGDNEITLHLPPTLVSLKISYGEVMRLEFNPSFSFDDYLIHCSYNNTSSLNFNIQRGSLPNLKILQIENNGPGFIETHDSLIYASNKLANLSTKFSLINDLTFINLQSLTKLTLTTDYEFSQRLFDYTFPILKNLKEFSIMGGSNFNNYKESICKIIERILNIGKYAEWLTFPYIQIDKLSIEEVIQSFTNLKELSLVNVNDVVALDPIKLPNTIKTLNLINFNPKFIELNNIKHSSELEVISIGYKEEKNNYFEFDENELVKDVKGWKTIRFYGSSIKCYKE
ncbi:hypothetical protein CONCODRAFT_5788 [Conidiobolus coronatus NRRL 28638]|uniref:F-box domain-containing protein n=1 Tax=Conidiobolus coronatus (strain ATCC 28846 / CBS 209.66 / NRRL 28638) TaxID=796925 RepID=A0A137P971_CONC2|nr:hypothetical protein CONCODRAFT_5788 [Conidiobolus coronatus NRRL 28638]|eukprot:KXN71532.1 hypothetical protein CONCODRAFT_5788 [Conidiobolus coronatus NRRL 28638]